MESEDGKVSTVYRTGSAYSKENRKKRKYSFNKSELYSLEANLERFLFPFHSPLSIFPNVQLAKRIKISR
jgi:hypothetical protein